MLIYNFSHSHVHTTHTTLFNMRTTSQSLSCSHNSHHSLFNMRNTSQSLSCSHNSHYSLFNMRNTSQSLSCSHNSHHSLCNIRNFSQSLSCSHNSHHSLCNIRNFKLLLSRRNLQLTLTSVQLTPHQNSHTHSGTHSPSAGTPRKTHEQLSLFSGARKADISGCRPVVAVTLVGPLNCCLYHLRCSNYYCKNSSL